MDPVVLVTGGSSGIGRSLVEHLAGDYRVVTVSRRIERMRERYADDPRIEPIELDLSDTAAVVSTMRALLEEYGHVPYVVNNAGVGSTAPTTEVTPEDIEYAMQVNAFAPVYVMRELLPAMREHGFGRVVNVTSGAAIDCPTGAGPYSASKAALNVFTATAAREHADEDIRINLMSPGPCRTEMAPDAPLEPSACHPTADYLLDLEADGPTGRFFWLGYEVPLFPDLGDIEWEAAEPGEKLRRVL
jgi:NAD(P)-dependent dehydrogenase (short-subunit alcohol dehydrogenase family)